MKNPAFYLMIGIFYFRDKRGAHNSHDSSSTRQHVCDINYFLAVKALHFKLQSTAVSETRCNVDASLSNVV